MVVRHKNTFKPLERFREHFRSPHGIRPFEVARAAVYSYFFITLSFYRNHPSIVSLTLTFTVWQGKKIYVLILATGALVEEMEQNLVVEAYFKAGIQFFW